jgi:hypothetical protein
VYFELHSLIGGVTFAYSIEVEWVLLEENSGIRIKLREELSTLVGPQRREQIFIREDKSITLADGRKVEVASGIPCIPALVSLLPQGSKTVKALAPLFGELQAIRYYTFEPPWESDSDSGFVSNRQFESWLSRKGGNVALGNSVLMRLIDMSVNNADKFDEVKSLLGRNGLDVAELIDVHKFRPGIRDEQEMYWSVWFRASGSTDLLAFSDLSSGTQRIVAIVSSLVYDSSSTMLIEHPEDGIHSALLMKLMGVLKANSDRSQIVVTSHSSTVFDAVEPHEIRLVSIENGSTKLRPLTDKEIAAAAEYLECDGNLSDFLTLVEDE